DGNHGRFRHRDHRRATLATLTPAQLLRTHRTAAWVLEDRGAPRLAVGLHLSRALEDEACLDPLLDGLRELVEVESRHDARRVAERLHVHLNRLPRTPATNARRLAWLLLHGRLLALLGRDQAATRCFRKANL